MEVSPCPFYLYSAILTIIPRRYKPYGISSLANVVIKEVTCGSYHTAAVTVNGGLYTWGGGMYGKLGHGTETGCTEPKEVNLSGVIQASMRTDFD